MSKVSEDYEHYLFMLQERNKLLKKLRQKDTHQIELEKREQGFSLYLNGANLNKPKKAPSTRKGRPKTRQRASKTAGESEVNSIDVVVEKPVEDRARTAPSKRKNWVCDSLELKTEDGPAVHVAVPGLISGQYEEDFDPPPESSELNVSFEDIGTLRKSLGKDSTIFTNLRDSIENNLAEGEHLSCDSSCSEELDDCSPCASPSTQQEESGIVIEFASQHLSSISLVSHPSTVKIANGPEQGKKTVSRDEQTPLTSSTLNKEPIAIEGDRMAEFHSSVPTDPKLATRSLSAVRRKQALPQTGELDLSQDVINAVSTENEQMAGQNQCKLSKEGADKSQKAAEINESQPTGLLETIKHSVPNSELETIKHLVPNSELNDSQGVGPLEPITTPLPGSKSPQQERKMVEGVATSNEPQLALPDRPFSQFKPVLVNRYKTKLSSGSPSLVNQTPAAEIQSGDSLTEHTLSIITAKVKKMDASKQRRLIDLLNRLDTPAPPSHLHPPTTRERVPTPVWLESTHKERMYGDEAAPPARPTSTRTTGLRSKLNSQPTDRGSRPASGRVSELRGELDSGRFHGDVGSGRVSDSRGEMRSGRMSSLRVELESGRGLLSSRSDTFLPSLETDHDIQSSSSNPCLLSNTDIIFHEEDPGDQTLIGSEFDEHSPETSPPREPRLNTAVLAKGHRRLPLVDQSTEPYLISDASFHGDDQTTPIVASSHGDEQTTPIVAPPISSTVEPDVGSSQRDSWNRRSECLESISKFDHTHLGQLNADLQEDILESFLSDYRDKREQHTKATPRDEGFLTPELPRGRELVLHILSTWGDRFYVGLTGVEIYTVTGELAQIEQITASPRDINDLPEYSDDPRVVSNLVDGVNLTRDDLHMWLAPFTPGQDHTVTILFTQPTTLAILRVWNYNKSRIHSARGARLVEMTLDQRTIFHGEIARGDNCETILFTTDEDILYLVSQYDTFYQSQTLESGQLMASDPIDPYRPSTGDSSETHRPYTTADPQRQEAGEPSSTWQSGRGEGEEGREPGSTWQGDQFIEGSESLNTWQDLSKDEGRNEVAQESQECGQSLMYGRPQTVGQVLQIVLTENWGDPGSIGLTGLAVLTSSGEALQLRGEQISSEVEGQRSNFEAERLLDGVNVTCDSEHMWVVPFDSAQPPSLTLSLGTPTHITGIIVWNYNASVEDSYRGVKVLYAYLDGHPLTAETGWLVRRAPGHVEYEYGQLLSFTKDHTHLDPRVGGIMYPRGFVFQLQLLNSWGDPYYIGLNEVELIDSSGQVIPLTLDNIAAYPDSVNVLPGVTGDLRTPDKLIDGVCGVDEPQHMWLAPILPGVVNSLYVIFNEPRAVSGIRLWNYGKTPNRGVKDVAVLVDGLLVYSGTVPRVLSHARGILPTLQPPLDPFIVPLGEGAGLEGEATGSSQSDIQLTNNREVVAQAKKPPPLVANQDLRPMTSLTGYTQRQRHKHW